MFNKTKCEILNTIQYLSIRADILQKEFDSIEEIKQKWEKELNKKPIEAYPILQRINDRYKNIVGYLDLLSDQIELISEKIDKLTPKKKDKKII